MTTTAISRTLAFERWCFETWLRHLLVSMSDGGIVVLDGSEREQQLQWGGGDVALNCRYTGARKLAECKAERSYTGNLYLESWSNKAAGRPGWIHKRGPEYLLYFFLAHEVAYLIQLPALQDWFLPEAGNAAAQYEERPQGVVEQRNDSWGWCVPVQDVSAAVGLREFAGQPLRPCEYRGPRSRVRLDDDEFLPPRLFKGRR